MASDQNNIEAVLLRAADALRNSVPLHCNDATSREHSGAYSDVCHLIAAIGTSPLAEMFRAATKAAAPADAPFDEAKLRELAEFWSGKYHSALPMIRNGHEAAWKALVAYVKGAAPVPDTGIPTSGAVENWNKAIALLEEVCGPKVAAWWTLERRTRAFLDEVGAAPAHPGEGEAP